MIRRFLPTILLLLLNSSSFLFSQIRFHSDFESGSLGRAELIDSASLRINDDKTLLSYSYNIYSLHDPINPVDTSLAPSARWYHFLITGAKDKELYMNILNSDARRPMYSYDGKEYLRLTQEEAPDGRRLRITPQKDSIYIAYFTPYTFTYLRERIAKWAESPDVKLENIGSTAQGRPMYFLTITDPSYPDSLKKRVYMHGRVHTSESPSSWHFDKVIDILASDDDYAKAIKREVIFFILPFTNPDGVFNGLSRSNTQGINIEINYDRPDSLTAPEVKNIKGKLETIFAEGGIDLCLNMHSQSASHTTYWVHNAESTSQEHFKRLMLFANLTIDSNPHFFKNDLLFSAIAPRYLEGWIWGKDGGKCISLTFETPYTYYNKNRNSEWVTTGNLQQMGYNTVNAIGDYFGVSYNNRILLDTPENVGKSSWSIISDDDHIYFTDFYLKANKKNAIVRYQSDYLPKGEYRVYKWSVGELKEISDLHENEWVEIDRIEWNKSGKFVYKYRSTGIGDLANRIMLKRVE